MSKLKDIVRIFKNPNRPNLGHVCPKLGTNNVFFFTMELLKCKYYLSRIFTLDNSRKVPKYNNSRQLTSLYVAYCRKGKAKRKVSEPWSVCPTFGDKCQIVGEGGVMLQPHCVV